MLTSNVRPVCIREVGQYLAQSPLFKQENISFSDTILQSSGGLAHRETGRFPGGPLLQEYFRAPGRTCEFISLIIS